MQNCDAPMSGEVHKCFQEQLRNWSIVPKALSLFAAVVLCLVIYPGTVPTLRADSQPNASDNNPARISTGPVIAAKPERVAVGDRAGSSQIEWDTGSGSMGFVFVTEEGGRPVLFANGSRG